MDVVVVNNYDSFTFSMAHALELAGARCRVVPCDALTVDALLALAPDGFVVSAGPCTPHRAGASLGLIERLLELADPPPLLGICLGHQAIAVALGGRVVRARRPLHGRTSSLVHDGKQSLAGLPCPTAVARYNSLVVDPASLPAELEAAGHDELGELMALRHRRLPLEGVQFHPESHLCPDAGVVFATWTERCRQRRVAMAAPLMQAVP